MYGLTETCHCGHDKSSHYRDADAQPPEHGMCLGRGCECKLYVNEREPKPKGVPIRPAHVSWCKCYGCKQWDAAIVARGYPRINRP